MRYKTTTLHIPVRGRKMKLLVLRPADDAPNRLRIGVLWLHGGGYITGMPEMVHFTRARDLAAGHDAVVLSPAYRLAGQAPYPAALEDCHAALRFMYDHARGLASGVTGSWSAVRVLAADWRRRCVCMKRCGRYPDRISNAAVPDDR